MAVVIRNLAAATLYAGAMSLPPKLQRIVDLFAAAPKEIKLQALLDYSNRVPPLPPELAEHTERLEKVPECQSPFFLATEVTPDGGVILSFESPREAPTTRGYAGILSEGLAGATAEEVLAVPSDFYVDMGLEEVVSPLRLRGMDAILSRMKRQIAEQQQA